MTTTRYTRALVLAALTSVTLLSVGCAVVRGQETVGAYVDDASITTSIKAQFVKDPTVDATAIKVETLNGTVALSGFAKSGDEKLRAEHMARHTNGVREVRNNLLVRP